MSRDEAEFALRSMAIEALAICNQAGIARASITVVPQGNDDDGDWWHIDISQGDESVSVSCSYGEDV